MQILFFAHMTYTSVFFFFLINEDFIQKKQHKTSVSQASKTKGRRVVITTKSKELVDSKLGQSAYDILVLVNLYNINFMSIHHIFSEI